MIVLTVDGVQLDAYLIILFGNIAIPLVLDNIHMISKKCFEMCFPKMNFT